MKKRVYKLFPIVLGALLIFPTTALANEQPKPWKSPQPVNLSLFEMISAQWSRFEVSLEGDNGKGKIAIIDHSPVFDYSIVNSIDNGNLSNGDTVKIAATNRGGHIVKTIDYLITGLGAQANDETTDDLKALELHRTNQDLDATYGAVRFLNFNNLGSGSEVYLTNDQDKLGTTNRTSINFYRGTTTDNENPYGDWEDRNKIRFGYDSDKGKVWVELDAKYEYRAEYDTVKDADFNAIQFMLLNRESNSIVGLENIELNGQKIENTVLLGTSNWPKWNLEGDLQNSHGDFTLEADLVITGDQPQNEINKVEIMFGNK